MLQSSRFEIRRRLGSGGMGVVYEAWDRDRRTVVALKTLRQLEPRALIRFKNEFRALADLQHDNLVRLGELFSDGDRWYFTMELLDGVDFLTWVRGGFLSTGPRTDVDVDVNAHTAVVSPSISSSFDKKVPEGTPAPEILPPPPYDEARLRTGLAQLGRGLAALHASGKVHRDIKPSNVLVTPAGRVVLLDFGLVTEASGGRNDTETQIVGTAAYMAPEQAASRPIGPPADWYAVGAMLHEALTGHPPFTGAPLEILMDKQRREPPPASRWRPDVPVDLDAMCSEMLRLEPKARLWGDAALARLGVTDADPSPPQQFPTSSTAAHAPFVGRAEELAALADAWHKTRADEPRAVTVFVHGESGIGKSSLVRHFIADLEARDPGILTLTSRCYEREALPYKAFDGVVDAVSRHLSRLDPVEAALYLPKDAAILARLFPVLRRVPAMARVGEARVQSPQELRTRAFSALRELLQRISGARPVVLFIDDFQWADKDSIALLLHVMHGTQAPPVLLLATVWASAGDEVRALGELSGDTRHLELGGLGVDEARQLVEQLAGGRRAESESIAAEAAGHPLFLQELVRHVESGHERATVVRLDEALGERVETLDPPARKLLEIVAVAGEPILPRVAVDAAGLDAARGQNMVGLLRAAHLVRTTGGRAGDQIECYHDRVRLAVLGRMPSPKAHHAALAAALEAAGGVSPQVLVRHLEAAGETERAAAQAEVAARRASETLAFDRAAELFRTALRLGRHAGEDRRRLTIEHAEALVNAGRGAEAADVFLVAAEGADAATRLECRRKAAEYLLTTGQIQRGIEALAGVLAEIGETFPATPSRALASLLWHRLRLRLRGLGWKRRDPSEVSPRDLRLIDVYRSVAMGLSMVDTVRGADFQSRGLLKALEVGETARAARALGLECSFLSSQGGKARARISTLLTQMKSACGLLPEDPFMRSWSTGTEGIAHYLMGDFAEGAALLARSEEGFVEGTSGNAWEIATTRIFRCSIMRYAGRYADLAAMYHRHVPEAERRGDRYTEATVTRIASIIWLAADATEVCALDLDRRAWNPPEGSYHMQNWYEWRARSELAMYRRQPEVALASFEATWASLRRSKLARVQLTRTEAIWLHGRLALACAEQGKGDKDALLAIALRCAGKLEPEVAAYPFVWARLLRAGVAQQRGESDQVKTLLEEVIRLSAPAYLLTCGASAELALGRLVGGSQGETLVTRARERFAAEGVADIARFVPVLIPGLPV